MEDILLLDDLMLRWYYQHQVQMDLPKVVESVVNITFLSYLKTTPQLLSLTKLGCDPATVVLVTFFGDFVMMTVLRCWWQNDHVDDASTSFVKNKSPKLSSKPSPSSLTNIDVALWSMLSVSVSKFQFINVEIKKALRHWL